MKFCDQNDIKKSPSVALKVAVSSFVVSVHFHKAQVYNL